MNYKDLKTGSIIEMEILRNGSMKWIKGTVYVNKKEPFFQKRVLLDNGMDEPIIEHRMYLIRECK